MSTSNEQATTPDGKRTPAKEITDSLKKEVSDWDSIWITTFLAVFFGFILLLFNWTLAAFLVALASLSSGFVIGFLFGIPRIPRGTSAAPGTPQAHAQQAQTDNFGRVNNNLIEISDWLCKIIVGVGLVEIKSIPKQFQTLAEFLAGDVGATANPTMAGAIVIYFATVGFLFGYIATRTILTKLFDDVDNPSLDKAKKDMASQAQEQLNKEMGYQVAWTKGIIAQTKDMDQTFVDDAIDELERVHRALPERRKFAMTLSWLLGKKPHHKGPASPAQAVAVLNQTKAAMGQLGTYKKEDWAAIHFNLACFQELQREAMPDASVDQKKQLAAQVYANLRIAFENDPSNIADAKTDEDLQKIQKEKEFEDLVKEFERRP